MYHMQYFGDTCERGWVFSSSTMEFKGKKAFDEHVKEVFKGARKSEKSKLEKLYKIYPGRMESLNIAIKQAGSALDLARKDRIKEYAFDYQQLNVTSEEKSNGKVKKRASLAGQSIMKASKDTKRKLSLNIVDSVSGTKAKKAKISMREKLTKDDCKIDPCNGDKGTGKIFTSSQDYMYLLNFKY